MHLGEAWQSFFVLHWTSVAQIRGLFARYIAASRELEIRCQCELLIIDHHSILSRRGFVAK
jgi:hypothetical protein